VSKKTIFLQPYLKSKARKKNRADSMVQTVEQMPSKQELLSSNPHYCKNKQINKHKEKQQMLMRFW
jgi:hypothetical protein